MNKLLSTSIFIVGIIFCAIIVATGIYIDSEYKRHELLIIDYNRRKENLLLEQRNLEEKIANLNQSLKLERSKEQDLSSTLAELTKQDVDIKAKAATPQPVAVTTTSQPKPRVTRAS